MLQRIWYRCVRVYIRIGLFFFFKKMVVSGLENVPEKGAVLLVSNHKNALIDPLLIATSLKRHIHFLTRASAFKVKLVKWLLSTVNMLPIYRMRDGKETLAKNEEIFQQCYTILHNQKCLLIFPEGTHDIRRLIRPLSKGFTRIVFGFLEKHPEIELKILPIGLNYTNARKFGEGVSIYYGKPVSANPFYDQENINASTIELKNTISEKLKELTVHIEDDSYDETMEKLGNADFLDPLSINHQLNNPESILTAPAKDDSPSFLWKLLKILVGLNSIFPLVIYKLIKPNIREIEFISTTKFAIGITAFPLFYILQAFVIHYYFGMQIALFYLILSVLAVLILNKTK